ncbi:hypothetical protein [Altererythrobacter sp. C41]|uniref:hypothetical protein n=1 Tax=Altererythrobacter sp. C41 TaxID=2806021 RepID=UPI0019338C8C|nr:hypothetical protein [Altererythrobacter sp. C41]MBM0171433.1 hypothetical protein [Altererythrobacter sp. C41]
MPRKQKLKVFRTPTGFHDAYVAAPSQKAALQAWGSEHDLFARGIAEKVDDPELTREPLAKPGVVIRRLRGNMSEQIAALPKSKSARKRSPAPKPVDLPAENPPARPKKRADPPKPKPKPDRTALDEAERALAEAEKRQVKEHRALVRRLADLERALRELERRHSSELTKLQKNVEKLRSRYDRAMEEWRN